MLQKILNLIKNDKQIKSRNKFSFIEAINEMLNKEKNANELEKDILLAHIVNNYDFIKILISKVEGEKPKGEMYYLEVTKYEASALFEKTLYDEDAFEGEWAMRDKGVSTLIMKLKNLKKAIEDNNTEFL